MGSSDLSQGDAFWGLAFERQHGGWQAPMILADLSQMDLSWGLQFNSSGQANPAAGTAATIFPEKALPVPPSVAA
jgi:hypothetical protein